MQGWESYPMSLPSEIRGSEDICHLQSLLHERAPSLFVADQSKANLEVLFQNTGKYSDHIVLNATKTYVAGYEREKHNSERQGDRI